MTSRRVRWLVAVMCVLAVLRIVVWLQPKVAPPAVVEAIVHKPTNNLAAPPAPTAQLRPPIDAGAVRSAPPREAAESFNVPGNAFAVRPPPPPPYVPPVIVAKVKPLLPPPPVVAAAPVEPPPPPMPYQVIGTWDDPSAPGVFLSSANGTLLARPGMTLQAEYKVTAITPQQISLVHLATQREIRLALNRPPLSPRAYP